MDDVPAELILPPGPDAQDTAVALTRSWLVGRGTLDLGTLGATPSGPLLRVAVAGVQDIAAVLVLAVLEEAKDTTVAPARVRGRDLDGL